MLLDEQSRRLKQFVNENQHYQFNRFFLVFPEDQKFFAFMGKIFKQFVLNKTVSTNLDNVFLQSLTKTKLFEEKYHQKLQNQVFKAAGDKSHF